VKEGVVKKLAQKNQMDKRSDKETKKYLKQKHHRDIVKIKKSEFKI
jgi:hypothetical protein